MTEEAPQVEVIPTSGDTPITPRQAADALSQHRWKRDAGEDRAAEPAPAQEAQPSEEPAPVISDPVEQTVTTDPPDSAPIEPPRSWTKEDKDEFLTYPREAQEKIARREQDRETALRRGQNDNAEQRKAVEAERTQLEQARKQYEEALPVLLTTLQQQGEFSDIKSLDDVKRLARDDWPRYASWDAQQKQIAAVQQELKTSQERQTQDFQTKWAQFAKDEDAKFIEVAPEMADKDKASKIANGSISLLKEIGFSEADLGKLWNGEASLSLRDHRAQLLIREAFLYRQAKAAIPKASVKTVPQVQRPGVAQPRNADADSTIAARDKDFDAKPDWKNAAKLLIAQRAARR